MEDVINFARFDSYMPTRPVVTSRYLRHMALSGGETAAVREPDGVVPLGKRGGAGWAGLDGVEQGGVDFKTVTLLDQLQALVARGDKWSSFRSGNMRRYPSPPHTTPQSRSPPPTFHLNPSEVVWIALDLQMSTHEFHLTCDCHSD